MRHLSNTALYGAVSEGPSSLPEGLSAHLEKCDECSEAVAALFELQSAFGPVLYAEPATGECLTTDELAEFLEGDPSDKANISAHLEKCDSCFEAAAFYFSESATMRKGAPPAPMNPTILNVRPAVAPRAETRWGGIIEGWFGSLPAFATALALFIALYSTPPAPGVAVLKGSPFFHVHHARADSFPYFYFGGEGKEDETVPADMRVTAQRGRIAFDWKPVAGVTSYYFFLQETVDGEPSKVREIKDVVPPLFMPSEDFRPGAVYRWVASGTLGGQRYFDGMVEFRVSAK
jgi:hypothetical protein